MERRLHRDQSLGAPPHVPHGAEARLRQRPAAVVSGQHVAVSRVLSTEHNAVGGAKLELIQALARDHLEVGHPAVGLLLPHLPHRLAEGHHTAIEDHGVRVAGQTQLHRFAGQLLARLQDLVGPSSIERHTDVRHRPCLRRVVHQVALVRAPQLEHRPVLLQLDLLHQRLGDVGGQDEELRRQALHLQALGARRRTPYALHTALQALALALLAALLLRLRVDQRVLLQERVLPGIEFLANLRVLTPLPHQGHRHVELLLLDHLRFTELDKSMSKPQTLINLIYKLLYHN